MDKTINPVVVGEAIGTEELFVAEVTADSEAAYTTATPESVAPMATVARETTTNTKTRYYGNAAIFTDSAEGETKLTVVIPGLTVQGRAKLIGKPFDATAGKMYDPGAVNPKFYAMGYVVNRPNGIKEFIWFNKGKFAIPKDEAETKTDNINEKPLTLEYVAVRTQKKFQLDANTQDGVKSISADTSNVAFTGAATWFNAVQTPPAIVAG